MNTSQNREDLEEQEEIKASPRFFSYIFGKYRKNKQRQVQDIIAMSVEESMLVVQQ